MILYLDTSSLVKTYLEELHSDLVRDWVKDATLHLSPRDGLVMEPVVEYG